MTTALEPRPVGASAIWIQAIRPATLLAGVVPVLVGSAMAAREGYFYVIPALAALAGALLLQIGCNFANDLFDFLSGADDENRVGPARMTQKGHVSVRTMAWATGVAMGLAVLVGVYLVWIAGWPIVVIGLSGVLAGVFYTAGSKPLGYLGLGEVLVFLFFGIAAVGGSYYIQTDRITLPVLLVAGSIGLLASAILVVNNLRDRHTDARVGKRTLAVRLGERATRLEYLGLIVLAYLPPLYYAYATNTMGALLVLASLPLAILLWRRFKRADGDALNPLLGKTAQLETIFGLLFAVGVLL